MTTPTADWAGYQETQVGIEVNAAAIEVRREAAVRERARLDDHECPVCGARHWQGETGS